VTTRGIYRRISDDRAGEGLGVARQEADCRAHAAGRGWDITHVHRENDTSAFVRRIIVLPAAAAPAASYDLSFATPPTTSTRCFAYDLDRIARDPDDPIDVCETPSPGPSPATLNLSHDGGITMARVAVAVADQASRDTTRRVRRAQQNQAAGGRWLCNALADRAGAARPLPPADARQTGRLRV
jgi:site-specific DNA recombinase